MFWETLRKLFGNIVVRADKGLTDRLRVFVEAFTARMHSVQKRLSESQLLQ